MERRIGWLISDCCVEEGVGVGSGGVVVVRYDGGRFER